MTTNDAKTSLRETTVRDTTEEATTDRAPTGVCLTGECPTGEGDICFIDGLQFHDFMSAFGHALAFGLWVVTLHQAFGHKGHLTYDR